MNFIFGVIVGVMGLFTYQAIVNDPNIGKNLGAKVGSFIEEKLSPSQEQKDE